MKIDPSKVVIPQFQELVELLEKHDKDRKSNLSITELDNLVRELEMLKMNRMYSPEKSAYLNRFEIVKETAIEVVSVMKTRRMISITIEKFMHIIITKALAKWRGSRR